MAQGTIKVTNGSVDVVGTGTAFTSMKAGSFLTFVLTGVAYTVAIDSIQSATALKLAVKFDGPTTSGVAFNESPVGSMALATMGVTVQAQKALRMMIADQTNWREVFSNKQTITVTLPDGTQYSGYSWGYISDMLKAINVPALEAIRDQTVAARNQAQTYATNASNSATAASTANTGAQAAKTAAETARTGAQTAQQGAAASATTAGTAATTATNKATEATNQAALAKQYADSVNPANLLAKANNLSDVASISNARNNIESPWSRKSGLGSDVNLNTLTGYANVGWHPQPSSANATAANNYPTQNAGTLQVMYSGANGANECTQIYYPYNGDEYYKRRGMPSGSTINWTNWKVFSDMDVARDKVNERLLESGINTTGSINQNDANNLQYNGFFAGAGVNGVNFKNAYGSGLVLRRVNDTTQVQWSAEGRMSARFCSQGTSWSSWTDSVLVGDFGVGVSDAKPPTTQGGSFIADSNGSTTWAPANGGGFQSAYANSRLFQAFITPSNAFYIRYNDTGAPQATRAAKPWTQMQAVGTSDANFKKIMGALNVEAALDNVNRLEFKLFKYTFDDPDRSSRRGIIAQQAMTVDREYVHSADNAGIMTLDLNPLMMDALASIKALRRRDEDNKLRIKALEEKVLSLGGSAE